MRHIFVGCCGECPRFYEGENSFYTGEAWTEDSCLNGCGTIKDKTKILRTCNLSWVYGEDNYAD